MTSADLQPPPDTTRPGPLPVGHTLPKSSTGNGSLRIALLTYRGNPTCGGQGVYISALSAALLALGHHVEVFSGDPTPDVDPGVTLHTVPRAESARGTTPREWLGWANPAGMVDLYERHQNKTGIFGEPLGFSWRSRRVLGRRPDFDIVHDNQSLGYGLLAVRRHVPVTSTIHHPLSVDRRIALDHLEERIARIGVERFYRCTKMQARVAGRLERVLTVSASSRNDISRDFAVDPARIDVVPVAVDSDVFRPLRAISPVPGRIVTTASSNQVLKGLHVLVRALPAVREVHPEAHLVVVGSRPDDGATADALSETGLGGTGPDSPVTFTSGLSQRELVELYASAEVACVPSLYEGFSLPAAEAMSCGVPLVSTDGGALVDVAGPHGEAAFVADVDDGEALGQLLIDALRTPEHHRRTIGAAGRARVLERWSWERTARRTVDHYRAVIEAWNHH